MSDNVAEARRASANWRARNTSEDAGEERKFVLFIAYHFPPVKVSSGLQRTLKFAQYMRDFGWKVAVLSVNPRVYPSVSSEQLAEIPRDVIVRRAFGLNTRRHASIRGRYPRLLALPDETVTWWCGGVPAGLQLIRTVNPQVIWSTYPIATAHLIGLTLRRLTGLPWVADFRDPMTEVGYPPDPRQWKVYRWLEERTIQRSTRAVFTTQGALRLYRERYPECASVRDGVVIANGYDETNFVEAEHALRERPNRRDKRVVLLHSGVLYPEQRDPRPFFTALRKLKERGEIPAHGLEVRLRATGHDKGHARASESAGVAELVRFKPPIPYRDALAEMLQADGLLLFQAGSCNRQVPAKLYEYLRSRRPILALTDPEGETAAVMRQAGLDTIAPLNDSDAIAVALAKFLNRVCDGTAPVASRAFTQKQSRYRLTGQLASCLDEVVAGAGAYRQREA